MSKIELKNINKTLKHREILSDITYTFESGKIYGLHGKNASGKTMLLRAICGLISLDSGSVMIDDKKLGTDIEFPESVGVIIENMTLLPEYTAYQNLKMLSKIKKIATDDDIKATLNSVGLDPDDKKKVKEFSLGMRQKLNIAQAIFENPQIILLDEPTNALDEKSVIAVRNILIDLRSKGKIIIIASHNKEDLDALCDKIILIEDGKIRKDAE
ncbi:MAG: ABC transporter ATP-binding protein [Clostridiales bacterium]|nr:ABC transporter ATP-binding protein [Clostridiales bacterium]